MRCIWVARLLLLFRFPKFCLHRTTSWISCESVPVPSRLVLSDLVFIRLVPGSFAIKIELVALAGALLQSFRSGILPLKIIAFYSKIRVELALKLFEMWYASQCSFCRLSGVYCRNFVQTCKWANSTWDERDKCFEVSFVHHKVIVSR